MKVNVNERVGLKLEVNSDFGFKKMEAAVGPALQAGLPLPSEVAYQV